MPSSNSWSLDRRPWVYFFLFLAANTLISYAPLSFEIKIVLGLLGVGLPLYVAFRTSPSPARREKPAYLIESLSSPATWIWTFSLISLVVLRFDKLETLFRWPTLDEGWNGILAIRLSQHWSWRFFYTFGQAPPLPVWGAALLFKLGTPPALALWLPSALVSLATVPMGYFAARQFFSKSFSLICGGLLAFSYWPLFIGRFCHQGTWLPLWVELVLFAWGGFLKAKGDGVQRKWAVGLGLALGVGSFTFTPWMAAAGFFLLTITWGMLAGTKKNPGNLSWFCGSFLVGLIPFLLAVGREGYGQHILSLSPWGGWFHHFDFFWNLFRYFAVLVWTSLDPEPAYTPLWGGFLNPLLGAFFFVGIIEMFRLRRLRLVQWTAAAFLAFLLPGALSPNLETFRVAQVMPLLLFITALGISSLLGKFPSKNRLAFFGLLLAFTGILDFNLMAAPYRDPEAHPENFGRPVKSLERYRAYEILKSVPDQWLLSDFDSNSYNDPTLSVMTHGLEGIPGKADQYFVFMNIHYKPFLQKRFPSAGWYDLSGGLMEADGGHTLALFQEPSVVSNPGSYLPYHWYLPHEVFRQADLLRFSQTKADFGTVLRVLESAYPMVKGDPFLESVFWDKRAAYEYEALNYDQQLFSYRMAVTRGYPTAELYYKMGQLLLVGGHRAEARRAFLKATQAPLDLTPAHILLAGPMGKP